MMMMMVVVMIMAIVDMLVVTMPVSLVVVLVFILVIVVVTSVIVPIIGSLVMMVTLRLHLATAGATTRRAPATWKDTPNVSLETVAKGFPGAAPIVLGLIVETLAPRSGTIVAVDALILFVVVFVGLVVLCRLF